MNSVENLAKIADNVLPKDELQNFLLDFAARLKDKTFRFVYDRQNMGSKIVFVR